MLYSSTQLIIDFTSSLYLGIQHDSHSLKPWKTLTTGRPISITNPTSYSKIEKRIAALQGLEEGAIAKSTFHLFWDLFSILGIGNYIAFADSKNYPVAQWGLDRFSSMGNTVVQYKHHDSYGLNKLLASRVKSGERPLVVTSSWCQKSGQFAPLKDYLNSIRLYDGILIVDDSQSLGIFGQDPNYSQPYGYSGGGVLKYLNISGPDIILISSLAKAFGVPIGIMSGSNEVIKHFKLLSNTRYHCSPPSYADISAAEHALYINDQFGDQQRQKLGTLVRNFKMNLLDCGISTTESLFPLQKLFLPLEVDILSFYTKLRQAGIESILSGSNKAEEYSIFFSLNANHTSLEMVLASQVIKHLIEEFF